MAIRGQGTHSDEVVARGTLKLTSIPHLLAKTSGLGFRLRAEVYGLGLRGFSDIPRSSKTTRKA